MLSSWLPDPRSSSLERCDTKVHGRLGALLANRGVIHAREVPVDLLVAHREYEGPDHDGENDLCKRY